MTFVFVGMVGVERAWKHKCPQGKWLVMTESQLGLDDGSKVRRRRWPHLADNWPIGCLFCGRFPTE